MSLRNLAASNMYETTLSWINNKDDPCLLRRACEMASQ